MFLKIIYIQQKTGPLLNRSLCVPIYGDVIIVLPNYLTLANSMSVRARFANFSLLLAVSSSFLAVAASP